MDVIIIKTGYTDRIIIGEQDNDMAVIYTDKVWLINDDDVYELCEKLFAEQEIDCSGMVVFKDMDVGECIDIVRDLHYCACYDVESEEVFEVECGLPLALALGGPPKKQVMIVTFDCESG